MRKSLSIIAAIVLLASCGRPRNVDVAAVMEDLGTRYHAICADSVLTDDQKESEIKELFMESYLEHAKDSAGLKIFGAIAAMEDPDKVIELYESSDDIIRENEKVKENIARLHNATTTAEGCQYAEIEGPDAITGDTLSLRQMLSEGKPVLVDFFASWCGPCRREIENRLKALAAEGRIAILGVAVWEKTVDDTRNVIEKLGITWPVVYSCDLEVAPDSTYGVLAVPTMLVISPDGTIIARGHSVEDFEEKIANFR